MPNLFDEGYKASTEMLDRIPEDDAVISDAKKLQKKREHALDSVEKAKKKEKEAKESH